MSDSITIRLEPIGIEKIVNKGRMGRNLKIHQPHISGIIARFPGYFYIKNVSCLNINRNSDVWDDNPENERTIF